MSIEVTINPGGITRTILGVPGPTVPQGPTGPEGLPGNDGDNAVPGEFGTSSPVNIDYVASRGVNLFTNVAGLLCNSYNLYSRFSFDPIVTPNLPGSFRFEGYGAGSLQSIEFMAVDPNIAYRLSAYIRQEGLPGDWSAYTWGERHRMYMGISCFDIDRQEIISDNHKRYHDGGIDSLTTITAPLTPGDTTITVANANGWNNGSGSMAYHAGVIIFEYKNSAGVKYDDYSRIYQRALWNAGGINKTTGIITLNQPFPAALGNPDDANGTWPVGTRIANQSAGGVKYALYAALIVPEVDKWYRTTNHMGGLDRSGKDIQGNFPPATAFTRVFISPNDTNRAGGSGGFPDTGAAHSTWFAGISVAPEPQAVLVANAEGSKSLKVSKANLSTNLMDVVTAALTVEEV